MLLFPRHKMPASGPVIFDKFGVCLVSYCTGFSDRVSTVGRMLVVLCPSSAMTAIQILQSHLNQTAVCSPTVCSTQCRESHAVVSTYPPMG